MNRVLAAARLEVRVELRYQIAAVAAALAAAWTALLLLLPAGTAQVVGPFVLIVDTATFGTFFIAALFLYERGEGALASLCTSPLRFGEYLGVRLTTLTTLSLAAAIPIAFAAGRSATLLWPVLLGVACTGLLVLSSSFVLVLPYRSLTGFLTTAPLLIMPLLAAPLALLVGLSHPLGYLIPTTGAAELIRSGVDGVPLPWWRTVAIVGYLLGWVGVSVALGRWRFTRQLTRPRAARADHPPASRGLAAHGGWIRTFARVDLRSVRMERLLLLVAAAPVGLALAIRFGYGPASGYLRQRFGVDLSPYTGVVLDLLVIVHVPIIMGMIGSLLVLDDIDERRLLLFRVTPVTLERYLSYRIVSVGLLALAGLLIAIPLSGLDTAPLLALLPAAVLAAALAPLMMLGVAAFAANKVQGIAALKVLGGLVMGLAALPWWLPGPARWALLVLPPDAVTYAQRSAETGDWPGVVLALCVGLAATVAVGAALTVRTIRRLTH